MKTPFFKVVVLGAFVLGLFFHSPITTHAQNPLQGGLNTTAQQSGIDVRQEPDAVLTNTTARIINGLLALVGVILLVLLIYGGILYMTAAGDDGRVAKAKGLMINAVIGLIVVILAYALAIFVIERLEATTTSDLKEFNDPVNN